MRNSLLLFVFYGFTAAAQYAPPAGQPGTSAMHKDSSAFVSWASACVIVRGPEDISNTNSLPASVGDSASATGPADNTVVSLGDGGVAVLTFSSPLTNGPGPDFAVFENAFSDDYLEFAFVEASSDGMNFFRLPATSNMQDTVQTGAFDLSEAAKVNNLAGKYRSSYGTPFDLAELQGMGGIDLNNVTHVRIIDVIGSLDPAYARYDQNGRKVNDPWPTPFPSGGFDLDAVGVIHDLTNILPEFSDHALAVFPNPVSSGGQVQLRLPVSVASISMDLLGMEGVVVQHAEMKSVNGMLSLRIGNVSAGIYTLKVNVSGQSMISKLVITE